MLKGKKILFGITGGIAAYKAPELVRRLKRAGAEVKVILTENASRLVAPAALETVSGQPVYRSLFPPAGSFDVQHVSLAKWADGLAVIPATANCLAKFSQGIADDLLSTVYLDFTRPVLVAPAMHTAMWEHPATQANVKTLKQRGVQVLEPARGDLACGDCGPGRLPDLPALVDHIARLVTPPTLAKKKILVTAGRTEEPLDPVRYLTNRSSGKMGYALARAAWLAGAEVTLVTGPADVVPPPVKVIRVQTAAEMFQAVQKNCQGQDAIFMAAAVADFRPAAPAKNKLKKGHVDRITLQSNPDILAWLGKRKGKTFLCGFALETDDAEKHAQEKLAQKNCDLLVLNNPREKGAGFGHDTNRVTLFSAGKKEAEKLPRLDKQEVAEILLARYLTARKR